MGLPQVETSVLAVNTVLLLLADAQELLVLHLLKNILVQLRRSNPVTKLRKLPVRGMVALQARNQPYLLNAAKSHFSLFLPLLFCYLFNKRLSAALTDT
jgi:hypothetical protein